MNKPDISFSGWPKISRWSRDVIVTEKIDGTNAQVYITDEGQIHAGCRTRWITPDEDNFGFAKWVEENAQELMKLGPGHHFGEWWGAGIQRKYGLKEKRFSLFNTHKWSDPAVRPACCSVVPVLYQGVLGNLTVDVCMTQLKDNGSLAAPGFMQPEGIVIYHSASGVSFKKTLENDESFKGAVANG